MKTKTKRIRLALTLVTAFAVAVGLLRKEEAQQQIITLPNGLKMQFVGVTYGTKHVQAGLAARVVSKVPSTVTNLVQRVLGKRLGPITSFQTPRASLCVWFKPAGTNLTGLDSCFEHARLADEQGSLSADARWIIFFRNGNPWPFAVFQVLPKHSRQLQCVVYLTHSSFGPGRDDEVGRVSFPNPLFGKLE